MVRPTIKLSPSDSQRHTSASITNRPDSTLTGDPHGMGLGVRSRNPLPDLSRTWPSVGGMPIIPMAVTVTG